MTRIPLAYAREAIDARFRNCRACGEEPSVMSGISDFGETIWVSARCHGSFEGFSMPAEVMSEPAKAIRSLIDWMDRLFDRDRNPDLLELYRYNRHPWNVRPNT